MLSSVSVSDFTDAARCFDFLVLLMRADFLLGFASFALSESESEFDEAADDESVEVDDAADETSFLTSGFGFSGVTFGIGFGGAPGRGYFLGLPRPRPDVELPDCRRISFTGAGGFSSSDSDEFEKMLLSFFDFAIAAVGGGGGAGFLGTGRALAAFDAAAADALGVG